MGINVFQLSDLGDQGIEMYLVESSRVVKGKSSSFVVFRHFVSDIPGRV